MRKKTYSGDPESGIRGSVRKKTEHGAVVQTGRSVRTAALAGGSMRDRAWAEIDLKNLRHNVKVLREALPGRCRIMAVVKANAYGHGSVPVSRCLNTFGIDAFAVAALDEAVTLRKNGVEGEILILGYTPATGVPLLCRYGLTQTVADADHAAELNGFGKPVRVHVKVDTGMSRLGEDFRHTAEIASIFTRRNLLVTGIFTHLSVSDSPGTADIAFTHRQIRNFSELLSGLKARRIAIPPIHIQSSYGVLNYPELHCSYARIGIALYGSLSAAGTGSTRSLDLRPVLALKSRVVLVRTIGAEESVGYGRIFTAQKETKIAVVSIGYADGFPRSVFTGKGYALVQGHRAPIAGRVCMDQLTLDITDIPGVTRGDTVTLIGKDGPEEIPVEEAAFGAGTIPNEVLSRLSDSRLKRVYLG